MTYHFRPASGFSDRHGCFVALVGGTNSGKTFSALRLATGIAGPKGKIAVIDTEGGRTLHLKSSFDFDVLMLDPPFRPNNFAESVRAAEDESYNVCVIDSFSMEWCGIGGVLDWQGEVTNEAIARQRAIALDRGWTFDENSARNKNKLVSWVAPKMAHKAMVYSLLQRKIPIIFVIRGEQSIDPETKKEAFKLVCDKSFPFEVTVSFRLASDRKGYIDLSNPGLWKMEGSHAIMFHDGEQLSEWHGKALEMWSRGVGIDAAVRAAMDGIGPYQEFWKRITNSDRDFLKSGHEERKKIAKEADEKQLIDSQASDITTQ